MAQSKAATDTVQDAAVVPPPVEQVGDDGVVAPKKSELKNADRISGPDVSDADIEDAPLRTGRPDVPIAVSLASGAGEHLPPDHTKFGPDGRPIDLAGLAA